MVVTSMTKNCLAEVTSEIIARCHAQMSRVFEDTFVCLVAIAAGIAAVGNAWGQCEAAKLVASSSAEEDRFGFANASNGRWALIGAPFTDIDGMSDCGAAHVFEFDGVWGLSAVLTPVDADANDEFGFSVSMGQDIALIGAPGADGIEADTGAAYVFRRVDGQWIQEARLVADDGATDDAFGCAVSIQGDRAYIGAEFADGDSPNVGAMYVFNFDGTEWDQWSKKTAPEPDNDRFGHAIAAHGEVVAVGAPYDDEGGAAAGAVYIYSPYAYERKYLASDSEPGDEFGCSVSVSGVVVLVGAMRDDDADPNDPDCDSGAAYVFNAATREQTHKLTPDDGAAGDYFGRSVCLDTTRAVIGSAYHDVVGENSGAVYLYRHDGSSWVEQPKIAPSDAAHGDTFGLCVSVNGSRVLAGAPGDDDQGSSAGSAYVFDGIFPAEFLFLPADGEFTGNIGQLVQVQGDRAVVGAPDEGPGLVHVLEQSGGVWHATDLIASDGQNLDDFGHSVSLDANVVAVGAPASSAGFLTGSVYVYRFDGLGWTEEATRLVAASVDEKDEFGSSVSVQGDRLLVGAVDFGPDGARTGGAFVFAYDGAQWVEEDQLLPSDGNNSDEFGCAVGSHDEWAAVGACDHYGSAPSSGAVYMYRRDGTEWSEIQELVPWDAEFNENFGQSVSLQADRIAIGAPDKQEPAGWTGAVYTFRLEDGIWQPEAKILASDADSGDKFGGSVGLNDESLIVGAPYNDDACPDDMTCNSGSAYTYKYEDGVWIEVEKYTAFEATEDDLFGASVAVDDEIILISAPQCQTHEGRAYFYDYRITDCNANGIVDICDIHSGTSEDLNGNGVPDECENQDCPADLNDDEVVNIDDLFAVLAAWGPCDDCPEDINDDAVVDIDDVFEVLANWGPCP